MTAKRSLILSMIIFGTIGIFRRYIPLSSSFLAVTRGILGSVFLLIVVMFKKDKISWAEIRKNLLWLIISGGLIGFNWIFLFEAYRYTTVATATLCYYLAPVFVILISPFLLKEKLTKRKFICSMIALLGMILVSGITKQGLNYVSEMKGILFGIVAALLYGSVIILNKRVQQISAYDKTIIQLAAAAIVVIPYALATEDMSKIKLDVNNILLVGIVGIVHTGIAYTLYFSSMKHMRAQSVALLSYIDPVVAIVLSALVLKEKITLVEMIGAILILGSTILSECKEEKD